MIRLALSKRVRKAQWPILLLTGRITSMLSLTKWCPDDHGFVNLRICSSHASEVLTAKGYVSPYFGGSGYLIQHTLFELVPFHDLNGNPRLGR